MKKAILIFTWVFSLLFCVSSFSQTATIRGTVSDGNAPLPGAGVKVKNSNTGAVTNSNGEFTINASGSDILVFTFIGYAVKEVPIDGRSVVNVTLEPDRQQLDEVVIQVAYGQQNKDKITGAITTIKGEDLVKAPVAGISNALIGLTSGIQAIQNSGEFGGEKATIRIRGIATLNSGGRDPFILVDGVERATYNDIDANEIESINILKDAASTTPYGVRGANGVILITTKQGKIGAPQVNFTANVAALQPIILPKFIESYDYAVLRNEAERNMGRAETFTAEDLELYRTGADPIFHPSKNWAKELLKPMSFQQRYNANISGGTERLRYFTSFGYFSQGGVYNKPEQDFGLPFKQKYDRYNIRMNFDFDVTDDFSLSVKLGEHISDNVIPNGGAFSAYDRAVNASPMSSPGFVNGKYIEGVIGLPSGVPHFNPWGQAGLTSKGGGNIEDIFSNTLNTSISAKYKLDKITKGLALRGMGAYDTYYQKTAARSKGFPAYTVMKAPASPGGMILYQSEDEGPYKNMSEGINDNERDKWRKMYGELAIDYKRTFGADHTVSGLVLGNISKAYYPDLLFKLPNAYLGLVSRVTYDFKKRYLTEFNMGYNGSENFPEGKRFGFFPSYGLGWVATEESFIPKNELLTFLKIRGSYGKVGNDQIGGKRYLYLNGPYALSNGGFHRVVFGEAGTNMAFYNVYNEGEIGNPDVTWETAVKHNIGAEIRMFSDRLSLTGDYFQEKRDNILWTLSTVPELVAAVLPAANIGKVENKGYELEVGFNDKIGDFNYWVKGMYSYAKNKIIYQDEATKRYEWLQKTGRSIDQYFGLIFEGFYNTQEEIDDPKRPISQWEESTGLKPGDMKYRDLNGDNKITTDDMGNVGYTNSPDVNYSIAGGFSWKGFDVSVLFQGTDNVSLSFTNATAYPFTNGWGAAQEWHMERWTAERYANGDPINFPRVELSPDRQHNYQSSTFWIQNASYFRFKNAELGYRFEPKALSKVGFKSLRIFVSGNNLFTWTDLKYSKDPDSREAWGRVTAPHRVFNGGVNFQF
jgi:TonB-linked SusC/RagA family outer membrane protein